MMDFTKSHVSEKDRNKWANLNDAINDRESSQEDELDKQFFRILDPSLHAFLLICLLLMSIKPRNGFFCQVLTLNSLFVTYNYKAMNILAV